MLEVLIAWMMNYSSRFGQEAPDEQIITLTSVYVKRDLYDVYTEESLKPHVKKSSFYYLYRKYFGPHKEYSLTPTVRITKYSSHSRCDLCVTLRQLSGIYKRLEDAQNCIERSMEMLDWK